MDHSLLDKQIYVGRVSIIVAVNLNIVEPHIHGLNNSKKPCMLGLKANDSAMVSKEALWPQNGFQY